jgi:hypothetical protein
MHLNSWLSKHELLSQILSYELRNMTQGQVHMDVIQESLLMSMSPSTISCIHRATFLYEHVLSDYSEVQLVPALLIANRLVTSTLVLHLTELLAGYRSDTQSLELPRIALNCLRCRSERKTRHLSDQPNFKLGVVVLLSKLGMLGQRPLNLYIYLPSSSSNVN